MAFRKALTSLFPTSLVVILIVLLMPFVLSSRIREFNPFSLLSFLSLYISPFAVFLMYSAYNVCRSPSWNSDGRKHSYNKSTGIFYHQNHVKEKGWKTVLYLLLLSFVSTFFKCVSFSPFSCSSLFLHKKYFLSTKLHFFFIFLVCLLFVWKRDFKPRLR